MKDLTKVPVTRPAINIGIIILSLGLLLASTSISANDTEEEMVLESWMSIPFDNTVEESELNIESWMSIPFDNTFEESELIIESWMINPWS